MNGTFELGETRNDENQMNKDDTQFTNLYADCTNNHSNLHTTVAIIHSHKPCQKISKAPHGQTISQQKSISMDGIQKIM